MIYTDILDEEVERVLESFRQAAAVSECNLFLSSIGFRIKDIYESKS